MKNPWVKWISPFLIVAFISTQAVPAFALRQTGLEEGSQRDDLAQALLTGNPEAALERLGTAARVAAHLGLLPPSAGGSTLLTTGLEEADRLKAREAIPLLMESIEGRRMELLARGEERPVFMLVDGDSSVGKSVFAQNFLDDKERNVVIFRLDAVTMQHHYTDFGEDEWDRWADVMHQRVQRALQKRKLKLVILEGYELMWLVRILSEKYRMPVDVTVNLWADWPTRVKNLREKAMVPPDRSDEVAGVNSWLRQNVQRYDFQVSYDFRIDNSAEGRLSKLAAGLEEGVRVLNVANTWAAASRRVSDHGTLETDLFQGKGVMVKIVRSGKKRPNLHQHPREEMYYILRGVGVVLLDGKTFVVRPGDAIQVPAGTPHSIWGYSTDDQTPAEVLFLRWDGTPYERKDISPVRADEWPIEQTVPSQFVLPSIYMNSWQGEVFPGGELSINRHRIEEGVDGKPLKIETQAEREMLLYATSGKVAVKQDGIKEEYQIQRGDVALLPSGGAFEIRNLGIGEAALFTVASRPSAGTRLAAELEEQAEDPDGDVREAWVAWDDARLAHWRAKGSETADRTELKRLQGELSSAQQALSNLLETRIKQLESRLQAAHQQVDAASHRLTEASMDPVQKGAKVDSAWREAQAAGAKVAGLGERIQRLAALQRHLTGISAQPSAAPQRLVLDDAQPIILPWNGDQPQPAGLETKPGDLLAGLRMQLGAANEALRVAHGRLAQANIDPDAEQRDSGVVEADAEVKSYVARVRNLQIQIHLAELQQLGAFVKASEAISDLKARPILIDASDDPRVAHLAQALALTLANEVIPELDFRLVIRKDRKDAFVQQLARIHPTAAEQFLLPRVISYAEEEDKGEALLDAFRQLRERFNFDSVQQMRNEGLLVVDQLTPSVVDEMKEFFTPGGLSFVSQEAVDRFKRLLEAA